MPSDFLRLSRLLSLSAENRVITNIGNAATDFTTDGGITHADDALVRIGSDGDGVSVLNSAGVAANTPLASVLIGTPVTPVAIAANSIIRSNITASGDYLIAVNKAGTSHMAFMADGSTGDTLIQASTGQSIDLYVAGAKEYDFAAASADFTGANLVNLGTLNTHAIQGGTSTLAMYSNNLSVFAATTSLQLLGVISDETGSGLLVFGTSPVLTTPDINAGTADSLTSLSVRSTGAAFDLTLATATIFTAGRTLTIDPGDSARIVTLTGNPTLADWFDQSVKIAASPTFVNLTLSTGQLTVTGGALALQQATIISTTATTLTLSPATTLQITPGTFATNITGAAGTTNQVLKVENTSNAAAASRAIIEVAVGGTTSTGSPEFRWTIPGGTSWHAGPQNNDSDIFKIGTGTAFGVAYLYIDGRTSGVATINQIGFNTNNFTASDGATAGIDVVRIATQNVTLAGTTQVTSLHAMLDVRAMNVYQSGGAVTVDKATGMGIYVPWAGPSVTLTHTSGIRVQGSGGGVNVSGLYIEALTGGTTASYGIILEDSATAGIWLSSNADSVDAAGGLLFGLSRDTNLYRVAANQLRTDDSLLLGGTLGLTGTRVSNIFTTNQTTTNAETVDSWGSTKQNITPYQNALEIIRDVSVVTYEHQAAFDPTGRRKLGVLAESISEGLVTPMDDYVGLGRGPRLDMLGLAALNTRAIQQLDSRIARLEHQLIAAGITPEE